MLPMNPTPNEEVEKVMERYMMACGTGHTDSAGKFWPSRETERQMKFMRAEISSLLSLEKERVRGDENLRLRMELVEHGEMTQGENGEPKDFVMTVEAWDKVFDRLSDKGDLR